MFLNKERREELIQAWLHEKKDLMVPVVPKVRLASSYREERWLQDHQSALHEARKRREEAKTGQTPMQALRNYMFGVTGGPASVSPPPVSQVQNNPWGIFIHIWGLPELLAELLPQDQAHVLEILRDLGF